ncbi:hypothetical protein BDR22DRAFT_816727 [Usnea florida]
MRLSLLLSLLLHSLAVSSLKPPSIASLLQQNSGVSLVNLTTTTNITTTAPAANINLAAKIEEGLQIVFSDDRFHGAGLMVVWLVHRRSAVAPYPTSLLDFLGFNLVFLLDGRQVMLDYGDWGEGRHWKGPRLGGYTPGAQYQEMQWEELQNLVSLDEADQLMTTAGYGGRDIRSVLMQDPRGRGLGYWFGYQNPVESVYLDALTREIFSDRTMG